MIANGNPKSAEKLRLLIYPYDEKGKGEQRKGEAEREAEKAEKRRSEKAEKGRSKKGRSRKEKEKQKEEEKGEQKREKQSKEAERSRERKRERRRCDEVYSPVTVLDSLLAGAFASSSEKVKLYLYLLTGLFFFTEQLLVHKQSVAHNHRTITN
ncbi:hypothetical protein DID88_010201 [Monilinia fructigena]|uniref:Uncharacterized protein n=1 Tax=Monilinia fructigena TaxID=38457 RepID=A0A395IKR6_9HELO|nr:hypothetical protein DID88_010201 [Monilinia fructigena]